MRLLAALTVLTVLGSDPVHADIVAFLCGTDPGNHCGATPGVQQIDPTTWKYNYTIEYDGSNNNSGNYPSVTIFGIPDVIAGTVTGGAGFSATEQSETAGAPHNNGFSSAAFQTLSNVTWTALTPAPAVTDFDIGESLESHAGPDTIAALTANNSGINLSGSPASQAVTSGQVANTPVPSSAPEPDTMVLVILGAGTVLAGILGRKK